METSPAGLLVPDGTLDKPLTPWEPYEVAHVQHAAEVAVRKGLVWQMVCGACLQAKRAAVLTVHQDAEGRTIAECDCTRHWMRRRRR